MRALTKNQHGFFGVEVAVIVIALAVIGVVAFSILSRDKITNFDECVAAGNPVMESYPEQCSDGEETFTKQVSETVVEKERVIYKQASYIDKDAQKQLQKQVVEPFIYYHEEILGRPLVQKVEVSPGDDGEGNIDPMNWGYIMSYTPKGEKPNSLFSTFYPDQGNGVIGYFVPQLCDDGGCRAYSGKFRKAYPDNFQAYLACKEIDKLPVNYGGVFELCYTI